MRTHAYPCRMPPRSVLVAILALLPGPLAIAEPAIDFNRDVRSILSENCFYCHGQDGNKRKADLRIDLREAAVEAGAIVPGNTGASVLLERIHSTDADVLMPPPSSNRRLSDEQKRMLDRWIAEGAEYKPHWAFTPPVRSSVPDVKERGWIRNEIDRYVRFKLDAVGLSPSPEADRPTLIRRLCADLLGLPPSPEEVDEFVSDPDPEAYEKLVDRLLESPHYGERMALPWLDAARYADSNGFQQDGDTWQWIWRDWVVKSLNADMPFDQFSIQQLAGDLLPDAPTQQATHDQKIASGFNRNHLLNGEGGAIAEEQRFNNLFDRVDTTSTTWLGLTMACAQCHDHKYDPVTQRDYYSLLDALNRVPESGAPTRFSARIRVALPVLELPSEENEKQLADLESQMKLLEAEVMPVIDAAYEAWRAGLLADGEPADAVSLSPYLATLLRKPAKDRSDSDEAAIEKHLRQHFNATAKEGVVKGLPKVNQYEASKRDFDQFKGDQIPRVMIMSDAKPRETKILDRGDYLSPKGEKLTFDVPLFLPPLPKGAPTNRLGLAQWLFLPEHPLVARVQVNRMWQHFFGVGLVKTAEDVGVQSEYPLHIELLDWLAVEFRERAWSQKQMHRLLVNSATYRQESKVRPEHLAKDPDNRLHGRASRFRMPSMVLRDVALSAAGLLDSRIGGQPVYPYQPDGIWEALAVTKERDFTYPASHGIDLYRRSIYTFWRRTVNPANLFDAANRQTCTVRAGLTSTPLHALTTLNDPTWVEAARVLAENSMKSATELDGRLAYAFRRVLARKPTDYEMGTLRRMHQRQLAISPDVHTATQLLSVGEHPRDESLDITQHAALTSVCLGILNFDEALTRE